MSEKYRVAILGLGKIAYAHLSGYVASENSDRITIVAGADPSEEARNRFSQETKARTYIDYRELLEKEEPDIVSVCTWPPLHPEMAEAAAASGAKGILCEKPMCVDLGGADRMLSAAKSANAVLVVGHQRRLVSRYIRARELIESGSIGDLIQVSAYAGGDLLTDGTHSVDLMRFMTGDSQALWVIGNVDLRERGPVNTSSQSFGFQEWNETHTRYGHPVETGASAIIQFANGARGTLEGGICSRPGYQRMMIYGSEGQIEVCGDNQVAGEPPLRARVRDEGGWLIPELQRDHPFAKEVSLMLDSIETGSIHPLNGDSARATQEILMAVFESALQRARIDLPLNKSEHPLLAIIGRDRL